MFILFLLLLPLLFSITPVLADPGFDEKYAPANRFNPTPPSLRSTARGNSLKNNPRVLSRFSTGRPLLRLVLLLIPTAAS